MLTTFEDRDEIAQLLYRYTHAIDDGDASTWAACFTEDAEFVTPQLTITGQEGLMGFAGQLRGGTMRHMVTNPVIDVQRDTAHGHANVLFFMKGALAGVGVYDDEFVRTNDGWKIRKRVFTIDDHRAPSA